jgi:hypothetical protein
MLAVTVGAFLLVVWGGPTKALFVFARNLQYLENALTKACPYFERLSSWDCPMLRRSFSKKMRSRTGVLGPVFKLYMAAGSGIWLQRLPASARG